MSLSPELPVSRFVRANDQRLHYQSWFLSSTITDISSISSQSVTTPLVLLHGLAAAASLWHLVAPQLLKYGAPVIAFDLRGHGESTKPHNGYDFFTLVADLHASFQSLKIQRAILVAHSWGASIALQYAATYPDEVADLILIDGAMIDTSHLPPADHQAFVSTLLPVSLNNIPRSTFLAYLKRGPLGAVWSAEIEDCLMRMVYVHDNDTISLRIRFSCQQAIMQAILEQPILQLYTQLQCPVLLLIAGLEAGGTGLPMVVYEQMREEGLQRIQSSFPTIQLSRLIDACHAIPLHRPTQLANEILGFLSCHRPFSN